MILQTYWPLSMGQMCRYLKVTPRISPHDIIFKRIKKRRIMRKMPITNTQKTHQQNLEL